MIIEQSRSRKIAFPLTLSPKKMFNAFIKFSPGNRFIILVLAAIVLVVGTYQATQLPVDVLPDLSRPRVIVMVECKMV